MSPECAHNAKLLECNINIIMGTVVVGRSGVDGGATRNHLRVTITIYNLSSQWMAGK